MVAQSTRQPAQALADGSKALQASRLFILGIKTGKTETKRGVLLVLARALQRLALLTQAQAMAQAQPGL
jgi:hypothetical protein